MECHKLDKKCEIYTESTQSKFNLNDKNRGGKTTYEVINKSGSSISILDVENCLMKDETQCDLLMINCSKKHAYFIEFKDSDLHQAIRQIENSIKKIKLNQPDSINARIILTKVYAPDLKTNAFKKFERTIIEQYKGTVTIKSKVLQETI